MSKELQVDIKLDSSKGDLNTETLYVMLTKNIKTADGNSIGSLCVYRRKQQISCVLYDYARKRGRRTMVVYPAPFLAAAQYLRISLKLEK